MTERRRGQQYSMADILRTLNSVTAAELEFAHEATPDEQRFLALRQELAALPQAEIDALLRDTLTLCNTTPGLGVKQALAVLHAIGSKSNNGHADA